MLKNINKKVFDFFINSHDFNGIPLRQISEDLNIDYSESIDFIKCLIETDEISIQSSSNPHIIRLTHYPKNSQLSILEEAKLYNVSSIQIGTISMNIEDTEYPICLYPSQKLLLNKRNLKEFEKTEYTRRLALGSPQLTPVFFDIEVLDRYINDPRYDFYFEEYSGSILYQHDENNNPILREEDQIFLKTFGLGFDSQNNRVAVVYLRYLKNLTAEHQVFWNSKEIKDECNVLEEYYNNTILGSWETSYSIFSGLIGELNCLNEISKIIFEKSLFMQDFENNRPREFTYFFSPTSKNYYDFVSLLDKMLSENINKKFFEGKVELYILKDIGNGLTERIQKGTIQLFEEWLISKFHSDNDDEIKNLFMPFKQIRKERQSPAHKIVKNQYDKKYNQLQIELITSAYNSLRSLRQIFQQHRKAKDFKIPKWLEEEQIKTF